MFYFLCEGEANKSEYLFMNAVIKEFHTNQEYKIYSASGNRRIYDKFLELSDEFKNGDIFVLLIDSMEGDTSYSGSSLILMLLSNISDICVSKGVIFRYSKYYCFEELFLTYSHILEMVDIDCEFRHRVEEIQRLILNGKNYFNICDLSYWRERYKHNIGVLRTREALSSCICNDITKRIKGNFKITKNSIGSCWISDCKDTTLHKNVCSQCRYQCKNSSFRDKLADLDNNSVSKLSLPFSTIFDTE